MHFKFSEEQEQLRESLLRFVQKDYSFEKRREILASTDGHSRTVWQHFADFGLLSLGIPEDDGGLGGNAVDLLRVMEVFGRGLVVEPYLSTVVLGAGLLVRCGSAAQRSQLLPEIVAGRKRLAFAHFEAGARYELSHVATTAQKDAHDKSGYVLNGSKSVVLHGGSADLLIVSTRTSGKPHDTAGLSLFLVDSKAKGVGLHSYPTHDGHRAAELTLKNVHVPGDALLGKKGSGLAEIEHTVQTGIAAVCAEAVGVMDALVEATLAYLKTRKQFGVPIGSFQVLQHRMADMVMQVEQARSMAYLASVKVDSSDADERRRTLAAAKAVVGQAARFVGQQAVQLHGGIGVTEELAVGHYFKRLTLINATFGDADHHLGAFSDLMVA